MDISEDEHGRIDGERMITVDSAALGQFLETVRAFGAMPDDVEPDVVEPGARATGRSILLHLPGNSLAAEALAAECSNRGITSIPSSGGDPLRQLATMQPDLFVWDATELGGIDADQVRSKIEATPETAFVSLSASIDTTTTRALLDIGVRAVLTHRCTVGTLVRSLERVLDGMILLDPELARAIAGVYGNGHEQLGSEQQRLLERVCAGVTDQQIAAELGVSRRTVQHHLSKLRARLGASSRADLVRWGVQNGI